MSCFWKFFRNRLAGLQSRQGTHPYFVKFSRDGIAWRHEPIRQATLGLSPSFGFPLMNGLALMNTRQATQAMWLDFDDFGVLG